MKSRGSVRFLCVLFSVILWVSLSGGLLGGRAGSRTDPDTEPAVSEIRVSPAGDNDPRDETAIAVNPKDDRNLVGVSKVIVGGASGLGVSQVAYYYSTNGGDTWGTGLISLTTPDKTWNRASDPSVVADTDGNFYICLLVLDEAGGTLDTGIYIYKSTDGGVTFGTAEPVAVDIGHIDSKRADKCYATIDLNETSPFKNTIYVVWVSAEPTRTVVLASHRQPGEGSFSEPRTLSHSGDMRGPVLAIGPNGEFYAVWQGMGNPRVMLFNASTDGGNTFFPSTVAHPDLNIYRYVGSLTDSPFNDPVVNGVRRVNSFPAIDVDRSNGPNRGMIYIAWAENINGLDADVFIQRLTPPGAGAPTVSDRVKVNDDQVAVDQFFPWLSVDPSNGAVEVVFYDRRDDPGNLLMNAYVARSTDGGVTFPVNIKVSNGSSNPLVQSTVGGSFGNAIGIGDYIGISALNGKAHMLWTDTRNGKQEIFYGKVVFEQSGGGGGGTPANDGCQAPQTVTALPFTDDRDTSAATSSPDDPQTCSGGSDTNSVWYSFTPAVNTVYGLDSANSAYDTVLSVYSGTCGSLAPVACNDDFQGTRSVLTFAATAGTTYLIEASGKGTGGSLALRLGFPTVTGIEYTTGPNGKPSLRITGAGITNGSATVVVRKSGVDVALTTNFFTTTPQGDGTVTQMFATKKKLKKLVKKGQPVIVTVESPGGSGRKSIPLTFTR